MTNKGLGITKVGLPVIKRKELVDYLNQDKIISLDTKFVDGVESSMVAKSIEGDRDTVLNALNLGGASYKEYLQKGEVEHIFNFSKNVSTTHMREIKNLKDELYQTKAEFVKLGYIKETNLHNGFFDNFNKNRIKYDFTSYEIKDVDENDPSILELYNDSNISFENISEFYVGQRLAITKKDTEKEEEGKTSGDLYAEICIIEEIDGNKIKINKEISRIDFDKFILVKTTGEYDGGSFIFGKITKNVPTGKERHTTLLDDINTDKFYINKPNSGFAVKFRIDQILRGALKQFTVKAKKENDPGDLSCYIIREKNEKDFVDIGRVEEFDEDKHIDDKIIIAKSNRIHEIDHEKGLITFDFRDPYTGKYPQIRIDNKKKHYAIIVSKEMIGGKKGPNNTNRWIFEMSTSEGNTDLHKHNETFYFEDKKGIMFNSSEDLNKYELNYSLTTVDILEKGYEPLKEGLYSRSYRLPSLSNEATNVRATLRANSEGRYLVDSNSFIIGTGLKRIKIKADTSKPDSYDMAFGSGITPGDIIIVGENPFEVIESSGDNITIKNISDEDGDDFLKEVRKGDPVFRVPYRIYVRAYNYTFENKGEEIKKVIKDELLIPLECKGSIMDDYYNNTGTTNRIIFENDLLKEGYIIPEEMTHFDMQIEWRTNFSQMDIKNAIQKKSLDLLGRIDEMTVSFNKAVYSEKSFDEIIDRE